MMHAMLGAYHKSYEVTSYQQKSSKPRNIWEVFVRDSHVTTNHSNVGDWFKVATKLGTYTLYGKGKRKIVKKFIHLSPKFSIALRYSADLRSALWVTS